MTRRSSAGAGHSLRRAIGAATAGIALALLATLLAIVPAGAAEGDQILIYGPSLAFQFETGFQNEETLAEATGATVTVWDEEQWSSASTVEFAMFDAIVFGDPNCGDDPSILATAVSTQEEWAPVVIGPMIVIGTDPVFHANGGGGGESSEFGTLQLSVSEAANALTTNAIEFAASGTGTGLYANLSCYYANASEPTQVELLEPFGSFTVHGEFSDTVLIEDGSHPSMNGLTSEDLSNWGVSVHEVFDSFPAATFDSIVRENQEGGSGLPYIIATGGGEPPPTEDHAQATYDGTQEVTVETTRDTESGFYSRVVVPPGLEPGVVTIDEFPADGSVPIPGVTNPATFCGERPCDRQIQVTVLPEGQTSANNPIQVFWFYTGATSNTKLYVKGDDESVASVVRPCRSPGIARPPKCLSSTTTLPSGDRQYLLLWRDGGDPVGAKRR